jgi:hypothetical protein
MMTERLNIARSFISPGEEHLWMGLTEGRDAKIKAIKKHLHEGNVDYLSTVHDNLALCQVFLDWLENLKEPIVPESKCYEAASLLQSKRQACWVWGEGAVGDESPETAAKGIQDKTMLHTLKLSNYRVLALIISFFRTLLLVSMSSL